MATFLLYFFILTTTPSVFLYVFAQSDSADTAPAKSFPSFTPQDNYLIDCGATSPTTLPGNKNFQPDQNTAKYLSYSGKDISASASENLTVPSNIYLNAKIFTTEATYTFHATSPGLHWIRLHFLPFKYNEYDLKTVKFSVQTDTLVLLRDVQFAKDEVIIKEFIVDVTNERYAIKFQPAKGSVAFINAIEFVTVPDKLLDTSVPVLFPVSQKFDLSKSNFVTMYRLNVGGPMLDSTNDTVGRNWLPDSQFRNNATGEEVSTQPSVINYPKSGGSPLIAPPTVYSSAVKMADSETTLPNFNISWTMDIDTTYSHLIRLHFCDIISKALNELYFNVYINDKMAISGLDLSSLTNHLATAFYKDFVVDSSMVSNPLVVRVSPVNDAQGFRNAILNGVEVFRMNNSVGSLDGEYGVDGKKQSGPSKTVAYVGFAMMFGAFVGLGAMAVKWQKRPQDWQKRNSFSSWLLPLHAGDTTFMSSASRKSQFFSSTMGGLGRYFSFAELSDATRNWDPTEIIGVGGFGNVYYGELDDGTKVAVKRGNPQSEQGINEFQTEIQMLSKLRHRHLVSLIGYCDESSEMILVYEFMENGPFRDHLYGKDMPPLTWKQRLDICIGAARGLHYLHTGAATGIIHRDVKTTNILLDENFVAKMADFGLSKDGPTTDQTHVSTAVKGSFGYLDPEYFRTQQLTDKSDVFSFGVVLLEALCARPAINPALPREQVNLAEWAMQWKRKGLLDKVLDPTLVGQVNPESLKKFAEAAEKCLADYGDERPTMGDVLWNLEYALQLQEASLQGKAEDENKAVIATPVCPPIFAPAPAPAVVVSTTDNQQSRNPAEVQAVDDNSETAMFAQFAALNGR
ncbi:PREDICTED: probable receptor-like protein kinase At4g39110 [Nicotiana attenuata]|uniref:Receptor-like protein kinase n=1 Tax=Nicotiana attenuata TaxID=49451 RepID=A0A1J6IKE6_NICAT|nr:PREDICTED: probable receptor-like protein kinase At4g39110 [Nicotiana attenuata]OIS98190.1 putative receptor-like protein kinase [Nicotiana attenuata]